MKTQCTEMLKPYDKVSAPDSLPKIKTLHDDFVNMLLTGQTTGGKVDPLS